MPAALILPLPLPDLRARYARLAAEVHQPAHEGSMPVWIGARRCGMAAPLARAALAGLDGVREDDTGLRIGDDLPAGAPRDALLARVADALRDAGCLRGWRGELLDVAAAGGDRLGAIERAATRPLGLLTFAVHLNAWTPDNALWIARRALSKSTDPGMWDTLVGGLSGSCETLEDSLLRECGEEAGLDPPDLICRSPLRTILRFQRQLPGEGMQVEDILVSTCVLAADARPENRDGEVMEIRHVPVATALAMLEAGEFTDEAAAVILEDMLYRAGGGLP